MMDKPTVAEQYMRATHTSNLRHLLDRPCDADKLLAAGYATKRDQRRILALKAWRMRVTGDTTEFALLVDALDARLHRQLARKGKRIGKTRQAVEQSLWWWLNPICHECHGRGHPVIEGTPVLDELRECASCGGTGQSDWRRLVHPDRHEAAEIVISLLDAYSAIVFADMASLLYKDLQLD